MVLTADVIAAITHIVASTTATMPMQQQVAAAQEPRPEGFRRALDERHYRKIHVFNGVGWKDFSFQFKAATGSSHEAGFLIAMLGGVGAERHCSWNYTELQLDSTNECRASFNILTTSLEGELLETLYNCNFNGLEAWRRLSKRFSPTTPLRAMQRLRRAVVREDEGIDLHLDAPSELRDAILQNSDKFVSISRPRSESSPW